MTEQKKKQKQKLAKALYETKEMFHVRVDNASNIKARKIQGNFLIAGLSKTFQLHILFLENVYVLASEAIVYGISKLTILKIRPGRIWQILPGSIVTEYEDLAWIDDRLI